MEFFFKFAYGLGIDELSHNSLALCLRLFHDSNQLKDVWTAFQSFQNFDLIAYRQLRQVWHFFSISFFFIFIFHYLDGDFLVVLFVDACVDVRECSLAKPLALLKSVLLVFYLIILEVTGVRVLLFQLFAHICVVLWKFVNIIVTLIGSSFLQSLSVAGQVRDYQQS